MPVPRLRMSGVLPLLSLSAFVSFFILIFSIIQVLPVMVAGHVTAAEGRVTLKYT
jgi:hypothetical protein